jgi:putative ABC transport system permease protein
MAFFENFRIALSALRANKLRSFLTTLGIIIGVMSVIAVVSIVQGLQHMITGELQGLGANFVQVIPRQQQQGPGMVSRQVKLTWDDGLALAEEVPGIDMITPMIIGNQELRFEELGHRTMLLGVDSDWTEVHNFAVDRGRFFTTLDQNDRKKVVVVGREVVDELGLGDEPIGQEIYVGRQSMTIVGVMEEKGQTLGQNMDDLAFVPFQTALQLFGREAGDQIQIRMRTDDGVDLDEFQERVAQVLRRRHDLSEDDSDDFQIITQDEMLEVTGTILAGITGVVGGIVSIALLVGGIGIMNIMLVSVTERTREIGLRKAVGARRQDVLLQFLIEAVTLSLIGGGIGLGVGYLIGSFAIQLIPGNLPAAYVPMWAVVLAFGFSALVGIVSGIYPAAKAAALDPIESLRYE